MFGLHAFKQMACVVAILVTTPIPTGQCSDLHVSRLQMSIVSIMFVLGFKKPHN
jgi:hypothetical protein